MNVDWLKEYFEEMIREHLCVGVFEQNVLVCCTDAPSMPYMESQVQEIGINTLPNYRGNGYATNAALRCIEEILRKGKVPLWSTSIDNIASQKLAEKVGFEKFAEVLMVTL